MECLSDEALASLLDAGKAPPESFDAHVDVCTRCRTLWLRLIRDHRPESPAERANDDTGSKSSREPELSNRYMVIAQLGRGSMGEVFRAYDPLVQREVALKRIRASAYDSQARARFEREARAMGQLQHPHVVTLYGTEKLAEGDLVLVMELVDGPQLGQWLRETSRPYREILARFVEAGAGLAAAHRAGMLHRDFKPANVLVAPTGAKVTDFGLAKAVDETAGEPGPSHVAGPEMVSAPGIAVGTPAYMAPEQFRGVATERSDQYSFCVSLWEALVGSRPFTGEDLGPTRPARPPPWPASAGPGWLGRTLRRGLSLDPSERWPSMDALLRQLSHRQRVLARGGWLAGGLVVGSLLTAAVIGSREQTDPCDEMPDEIAAAWSQPRRVAVAQQMDSIPGVEATRVERAMSRYVARWLVASAAVCRLAGDASVERLPRARAQRCLDGVALEATTTIEGLVHANAALAESALDLVADLPAPEFCHDLDALDRLAPRVHDPEVRAGVRDARTRIQRAVIDLRRGNSATCLDKLRELAPTVTEIGQPELTADFELARSKCLREAKDTTGASAAALEAYAAALTAGDELLAVRAATSLALAAADEDPGHARRWADVARATFERHRFRHPGLATAVYSSAAAIESAQGEVNRALEFLQTGQRVIADMNGPRSSMLALKLRELGLMANRFEVSPAAAREAVEHAREIFGPQHVETLQATNLLGIALTAKNEHSEAVEVLTDALALADARLDPADDLAYQESLLAGALADAGRYDDAVTVATTALERLQSPASGWLPRLLRRTLFLCELARGDLDQAQRWRDAISASETTDGVAQAELELIDAQLLAQQGRVDDARRAALAAMQLLRAAEREGRAHQRRMLLFEALLALEALNEPVDPTLWTELVSGGAAGPLLRAYLASVRNALRYRGPDAVERMATRLEQLATRIDEPELARAYATIAETARRG